MWSFTNSLFSGKIPSLISNPSTEPKIPFESTPDDTLSGIANQHGDIILA